MPYEIARHISVGGFDDELFKNKGIFEYKVLHITEFEELPEFVVANPKFTSWPNTQIKEASRMKI